MNDDVQMQSIMNFVELKQCTQIIVAGHHECQVLDSILSYKVSKSSPLRYAKDYLKALYTSTHCAMLSAEAQHRVLIEQNIIAQCHTLLDFAPLAAMFEDGSLEVVGLLLAPNGENCEIFSGIFSYNTTITMN